jgi:hypothetical protein
MAEDALYEIASTDAWRHLMARITEYKSRFEKELVTTVKKQDFLVSDVARCGGRVEAMEFLLSELQAVTRKMKSDVG